MPYDPILSKRVETVLQNEEGLTFKKMFGGLCFMIHGHMCCGVEKDRLVLRVGPKLYEPLLQKENIRPFDFTGKLLKGIVYVTPKGIQTDKELKNCIIQALEFVRSLPPK